MTDRPQLEQLIEAVRLHLENNVIPAIRAEPKLYFQTLVAANVLKIAQREVLSGQALMESDWAQLNGLLGENDAMPSDHQTAREQLTARQRALIADIRAGKYDESSSSTRLANYVQLQVKDQLILNAPALAERLRAEDESGQHPS